MKIKAGISSGGFTLGSDVSFPNTLSVLTGRNGSGKTRFLTAVNSNPGSVSLGGISLESKDILNLKELAPLMHGRGAGLRIDELVGMLRNGQYDEHGEIISDSATFMLYEREGGIDAFPLINIISRKSGKKPRDLTRDDVELYYSLPAEHVIGGVDVTEIFNQYLRSLDTNKYFKYRASEGEEVEFLGDHEFVARLGPKPWVELNKIMKEVFESKFFFEEPIYTREFTRVYGLIDSNGVAIRIDCLSSGEKVLLSLVLAVFSSQLIDGEFVRAPKLVMLDEADARLHPKMVVQMYWALTKFCERFGCRVILTTHSPTTVALAPDGGVYMVGDNSVIQASKDLAISDLLDGVPSIAVSPENRRQVYVESLYDVQSFQSIYDFMVSKAKYGLNNGVSLSFLPAGGKVPDKHLRDFLLRVAPKIEDEVVNEFVSGINGVGCCTQVYGAVEFLQKAGNKTVRGVVDWDGRNVSANGVEVFSDGRAYAIENVILDPLCLIDLITTLVPEKYPLSSFAGAEVDFDDWIYDLALLQRSVEVFVSTVLGESFIGDALIEYTSGVKLKTDSRYLYRRSENGHDLEKKIMKAFPMLARVVKHEGDLKRRIAGLHMTKKHSARFLPVDFLNVFKRLQVC